MRKRLPISPTIILSFIIVLISSVPFAYSAQVIVTWHPNKESDIAGYRLHFGSERGKYTSTVDVGNQTSWVLSNIGSGRRYYFAATAYDIDGNESDYSQEVVHTVGSDDSDGGSHDSDGDGISDDDERGIYGTDPSSADTDGDGISDGDEADFWGYRWGVDDDGDGLVNLLDSDSDGDGFSDGEEMYYGFDPCDATSRPSFPVMEIGETSVDHTWTQVAFNKVFFNAVVIAGPLSCNDEDPAVVRIRDVNSLGFEIRVQEWDYLDGLHSEETVNYIVMEAGSYALDQTLIEAGRFDTSNTDTFGAIAFDQVFNETPVVITAITTCNGSQTVTGRLQSIGTTSFEFCMQEQEVNTQKHGTEEVSFIAWEPSCGTAGGFVFEVDKTRNVVTHHSKTIAFTEPFMDIPVLVAHMQTTHGGGTATVRRDNKDFYGVDLKIEEEQSKHLETRHTTEVVGYMVFSSAD